MFIAVAAMALLSLHGCGTMADNRRWGEDATLRPGSDALCSSFMNAVSSPYVIIPAAGALALQVGGMDERLSSWAIRHTPTTGSTAQAERLSSDLRSVCFASFLTSMVFTPSGNDPGQWIASKAKGAAVQGSAAAINNETITLLKKASGRKRPDGGDDKSFPSGHAGNSALFASLAVRNVNVMNMPSTAKTSLDVMLHALMFTVAWERVEAGVHYPSDVLAGIAIGYFIGPFINDSFMGMEEQELKPVLSTSPDGLFMGFQKRF